MTQLDTKTRLLNAAETLFSLQGFSGTSMRAITTLAAANLAAANYHFGSKEELLSAVLQRRLQPLNQVRAERIKDLLAEAEAAMVRPKTDDLLRAFIEPTMAFRFSENNSNDFAVMIGRSMTAADPAVRDRFLALTRPLLSILHQGLCLALPHLSNELIFTRLFFTLGAMGHCLCFSGINQFFEAGSCNSPSDVTDLTHNLIAFGTAGLEAPC